MRKFKISNSISLLLMMFLSIVTQVITIAKSSIVAAQFGLSIEMDAFNFANSIISFVFGLIAGGVPTIIIPEYVKQKDYKDINKFLSLIYGLLFASILLIILFRSQIISTISSKDDYFINVTCNVLLILLFSQYLLSITNITGAYFQCNNYFNIPKIITLLSQLVVIILLLVYKKLTIYQYTFIISIGIFINFILDISIAKKLGWRFTVNFNFFTPGVKKYIKMFFPILISTGVYNLSLFIDSSIASRFDTGSLSVLSYSNQISGLVNAVLFGNLLTFIYPKIINLIEKKSGIEFFMDIIVLSHATICLIVVGFLIVGKEGIELLFGHGLFNSYAVNSVFLGTSIYLIGMQTNVIRDLIYRYFYAKGNTYIPAINSITVSILNIVFSLVFVYYIGFYGVILGTVVSSFCSLGMIFYRFLKIYKIKIKLMSFSFSIFRNILISIVCLVITVLIKRFCIIQNNLLCILVYGSVITLLFVLITLFFNRKVFTTLKKI